MREVDEVYRQLLERVCKLPEGYSLAVLVQKRSLALFQAAQVPHLVLLQGLTKAEWNLFETLIRSETRYCSYATLLAALHSETKDYCQHRINQALKSERSLLLKPLYSTLYRLKKKLQPFSLTIVGVVQAGYLLHSSLPAPNSMLDGALHEDSFFCSEKASS